MRYKSFATLFTSLFMMSGCLQNPAPIDGMENYYTNNNKYKKQQYRHIENEESNNQVFADEKQIEKKVFDPYQLPPVENLVESTEIQKIESESKTDFKIDEEKSDLDWNNIFSEVKNQKIETKEEVFQPQKIEIKKEIKKIETNNNLLKKPATKIIESNKAKEKKITPSTEPTKIIKKDEKKIPVQPISSKPSLSILKPANGLILTKYGKGQSSELDDGMTFAVSDKQVKSSGDGKIIYVDGENSSHKTIIVKHNDGLISSYSYNGNIKTSLNKEIKAGQTIGETNGEKNVLYFTVRQNGKTIDPEKIMK